MKKPDISRRGFLGKLTMAGAGSLMIPQMSFPATPGIPLPKTLKGKKILMVWGGWEGHQPKQCVDIFDPWIRSLDGDLTVSGTLDAYLDKPMMERVDLIIQIWTSGQITGEQEKALLKAVRNGAGLAGWHGGLGDSFRNNTGYQFMVGGQWVAHPGGVIPYVVHVVDPADPVTLGISDFNMHSEQYYLHVDPNMKVLATTTFSGKHSPWIDGCVIPVIWKKTYGKGRVFYSSLGHQAKDFEVPEALETMKRGILWASESRYAPKEPWVHPVYSGA